MSLLKYNIDAGGAAAWAESIRENLVSEAMPPWYVDPTGPAVKNGRGLTPRELDTIVTWATGGTPQGNLNKKPVDAPVTPNWTLGKPDLSIPMAKPFTLGPGVMQDTLDTTLPTNLTEAKWVRAVDLLPSTATMVRRATISLENGPVLAVWEPGDEAVAAPGGSGLQDSGGRQPAAAHRVQEELSGRATIQIRHQHDRPVLHRRTAVGQIHSIVCD